MKRSNIKCTMCGSHELKGVNFPVQVFPDGGCSEQVTSLICTKCGHYEFFNTKYIKKELEYDSSKDKYYGLLLKADKLECEYAEITSKLSNRKQEIIVKLENLDITVRTKIGLEDELKRIESELKSCENKYLVVANKLRAEAEQLRQEQDITSKTTPNSFTG